jgi:cyclase
MLKRRLIPILFLQHGWMVRSEGFGIHQVIGNPVVHVERMVQWDVDELIVIDISQGEDTVFEHARSDYRRPAAGDLLGFIRMIAGECRIPLTFGGRLRSFDDVKLRIQNGADKVTLNAMLFDSPATVTKIAKSFGAQAVVASIDYRVVDGATRVFRDHATHDTGLDAVAAARLAERAGAGEILLNAIDRDGAAGGYDLATIGAVVDAVRIPVICCGGAGHQRHFLECFERTAASAVAAGNIFHFTENAYPRAKQFLRAKGQAVR